MPRIVCYCQGNDPVFAALTEPDVTIGRHSANPISLTGHFIHQHHATLRRESDGRYRLFNLMYRNRVMLHGQPVPEEGVVLHHGDDFTLADVRCRYRDWEHAPPDWERPVVVTKATDQVVLTYCRYSHISAASDFSEDWEADVIPLLMTFFHR